MGRDFKIVVAQYLELLLARPASVVQGVARVIEVGGLEPVATPLDELIKDARQLLLGLLEEHPRGGEAPRDGPHLNGVAGRERKRLRR